MKEKNLRLTPLSLFLGLLIFINPFASAENIDPNNRYAYGENIGWLNFKPQVQGDPGVHVEDSKLTGYIWAENIGWISLSCENTSSCATVNYGVTNDGGGYLSGYAWSENAGWISFSCESTGTCGDVDYGVVIDSFGEFDGQAWGENIGWISVRSSGTVDYGVVTSWIADDQRDLDEDGVVDSIDNCPEPNSLQSDVDGDGKGDVCDVCPGDPHPLDTCEQNGSTALEILANDSGLIETPDGALTLNIPAGAVVDDTTISVTRILNQNPEVDVLIQQGDGTGIPLAVYDLKPDELTFDIPVNLSIIVDITDLNTQQRDLLNLYAYDQLEDEDVYVYVPIPDTDITVVEEPPGTFTALLIADIDQFSRVAAISPLDSDNDGLPDLFPPEDENTYGTDKKVEDTDEDELSDLTEVEMAARTGCPDPVNSDSDSDTLPDGQEVNLGIDPCNADTDGDGTPDNTDPLQLFLKMLTLTMMAQNTLMERTLDGLMPAPQDREGRESRLRTLNLPAICGLKILAG